MRGGELIAADEPTVFAKPLPDAVVMEDGQSDGCFVPPAPMRAMGVRFTARPTIFSINSSRPKQALGGGGGDSSAGMLCKCKTAGCVVFEKTDLA